MVIGLSGAGLKTFNQLLDQLYHRHTGQYKATKKIRLVAIEKSRYAYWPPGSLRASVVKGFEQKIVRSMDHLIPHKIQQHHPGMVMIFTGTQVLGLDLKQKFLVLDKACDGLEMEPENKQLKFDYLVIASGSSYAFPCRPPPEAERAEELKARLAELQSQMEESQSIVIVGAGVVGIELAGELSWQYRHSSKKKTITLVCSSDRLLPEQNPKLGASLTKQLGQRQVNIVYGSKVDLGALGISKTGKLDQMSKIGLVRRDGGESSDSIEGDFVFLAIGNKPNTTFIPDEYLEARSKLIKVNSYLQVVSDVEEEGLVGVYGVGDAINFDEAKLYAALDGQASTVSKNLWVDVMGLDDGLKVVHKPIKDTISIPLGACGGATELFGYTFGLGGWMTSVVKGWTLFLWMFNSMYPAQS